MRHSTLYSALLAGMIAGFSGCASLKRGDDAVDMAQATPQQTFFVEVREGNDEPLVKQLPISEPLVVQDVLEKTGVQSEFRKMDIVLERPVPGQLQPLRLDVEYNPSTKMAESQMNYAIRPGDRIIVTEDRSTVLDDIMEKALDHLGPLGDKAPSQFRR